VELTLEVEVRAEHLHQLTWTCTTTTSTSQVSWQHFYLENPIQHCKVDLLALYIYSFDYVLHAICLSLDCVD
jgi:hypothetical protein